MEIGSCWDDEAVGDGDSPTQGKEAVRNLLSPKVD